jgi:hypothetical protein
MFIFFFLIVCSFTLFFFFLFHMASLRVHLGLLFQNIQFKNRDFKMFDLKMRFLNMHISIWKNLSLIFKITCF